MKKVENWKHEYPNTHIQYHFFRLKMEDSGETIRQKITKKNTNSLVFVFQEARQKCLLFQ